MNGRRVLAIAGRIFRDLRHDRRSLALILVAPLFAMFVFGFAFGGSLHDLEVVVANPDRGVALPPTNETVRFSEEILNRLDPDMVKLRAVVSAQEAVAEVKEGHAWGAIIFPENFSRDLQATFLTGIPQGNRTVLLRLDQSNVNVAQAILQEVQAALRSLAVELGQLPPVILDASSPVYGEGAVFIDFFAPGIIVMAIYMMTTLLTLLSFVAERTSGTLARLLASPLTEGELVAGYALAFGIVGTLQAAFLLAVAKLAFAIITVGSLILAFALVALLAIASQSLGILLSAAARREAQAVQFIPFIILPVFLLSGILYPLEVLPGWLIPFAYAIPATYAVDGLRSVMLRGWGVEEIWGDIAALVVFVILLLALGRMLLARSRA